MLKFKFISFLLISFVAHSFELNSQVIISSLKGEYRNGQVFLTWNESNITDSTHFNVYLHNGSIDGNNISQAARIGHHIETSSASDWWQNPASFSIDSLEDKSHGFKIYDQVLDPASGLFVHTVESSDPTEMYFAVTYSNGGIEELSFSSGENTLIDPILGSVSTPKPIPLDNAPDPGSISGKSLILKLHGRGSDAGISNNANFLFFGDKSHGWREGIARKFYAVETEESIIIMPYDRIWIGRPLLHSRDKRDHVPAINSFWYGCNDKIYDEDLVDQGVMVDYTEQFLLYLVSWAQDYFGTDPAKTYLEGTSMGGAGGIFVGFHNPEVFARIDSKVPIVAYTDRSGSDERSSLYRLDGICGKPCDSTIYTSNAIRFIDHMNGEKIIREYDSELPYLVLCNGRNDESIPWINNPTFYQALNETNRGFYCYWDNGAHDMHDSLPDDFSKIYSMIPELKKSLSYPAFSQSSTSKDPGNGEKYNGDITGWMNRGVYWSEVVETADSWSVDIYSQGNFLQYPITFNLTPRNLTQFKLENNVMTLVEYSGLQQSIQVNEEGRVTVDGIVINSSQDTIKLKISKSTSSKAHLKKEVNFVVYPNPVKDKLSINLNKLYSIVKVEIINGSGQVISSQEYNSVAEFQLPFDYRPGIYFVKITTNGGENSVVKVIRN